MYGTELRQKRCGNRNSNISCCSYTFLIVNVPVKEFQVSPNSMGSIQTNKNYSVFIIDTCQVSSYFCEAKRTLKKSLHVPVKENKNPLFMQHIYSLYFTSFRITLVNSPLAYILVNGAKLVLKLRDMFAYKKKKSLIWATSKQKQVYLYAVNISETLNLCLRTFLQSQMGQFICNCNKSIRIQNCTSKFQDKPLSKFNFFTIVCSM